MFYDKCWQEKLQAEFAVRVETHGGNKLRTYRTFKNTYSTEPYVRIIAQKKFRSAYAKFRCGVAPINIELCRYGLARIPVEGRVCSHCNEVEDESHVLMYCPLYDDIRDQLTLSINDINLSLQDSSVQDQFIQLMSNPIYYRVVSKAICYILNKRRLIVYTGCAKKKKDILNIHIKSERINIFSQKFCWTESTIFVVKCQMFTFIVQLLMT